MIPLEMKVKTLPPIQSLAGAVFSGTNVDTSVPAYPAIVKFHLNIIDFCCLAFYTCDLCGAIGCDSFILDEQYGIPYMAVQQMSQHATIQHGEGL